MRMSAHHHGCPLTRGLQQCLPGSRPLCGSHRPQRVRKLPFLQALHHKICRVLTGEEHSAEYQIWRVTSFYTIILYTHSNLPWESLFPDRARIRIIVGLFFRIRAGNPRSEGEYPSHYLICKQGSPLSSNTGSFRMMYIFYTSIDCIRAIFLS